MVLVNVVVVEEVFSRHTSHLELAQASVLEDLIRKKCAEDLSFCAYLLGNKMTSDRLVNISQ